MDKLIIGGVIVASLLIAGLFPPVAVLLTAVVIVALFLVFNKL